MASGSRVLEARARRMRQLAAGGRGVDGEGEDEDELIELVETAKRNLHERQSHLETARKAGNRALLFGSVASVSFLLLAVAWWVGHLRETLLPPYCDSAWQDVPLAPDETNLLAVKRTLHPLVSVVIPYFNAEVYLAETVQGLAWQTFQDFEVVVVDDGSHTSSARRALEAQLMSRPSYSVGAVAGDKPRRTLPFPVRFVCHAKNRGVAAARNRGAAVSRGQLVAFLDPDDVLEPTALEKLVLLAAHMRSFPGGSPQFRNVFVYAGTQYFGDRTDHAMVEYSRRQLLAGNFLPSFALINRDSFLQAGGFCESVLSYEDYDLWLRLAGRNLGGKLLREPLFGFRQHAQARTHLIRRHLTADQCMDEMRSNNPVVFGDAASGMAHLARWPECHTRVLPLDGNVTVALDEWKAWVHSRQHKKTSADGLAALVTLMRQRQDPQRLLPIPFPLAVADGQGGRRTGLLYLMPWMVVNGADLYDYYILQTLADMQRFRITIVVEQPLPWPHPWKGLFEGVSDEIFYLPTLSNHTAGRQSVLDYLMLSRQASIVVNRNTEAGYAAFGRWSAGEFGVQMASTRAAVSSQQELRLVDILHLSEHGDDPRQPPAGAGGGGGKEAGAAEEEATPEWEVRSLPLHDRIHRRFLASEHLRNVLQARWHIGADDQRVRVLPPPVDPAYFTPALAQHRAATDADPPTVMFLGRLDAQKDPLLWLATACLVQRDAPETVFRILGDGPLHATLQHILWLAQDRQDSLDAGETAGEAGASNPLAGPGAAAAAAAAAGVGGHIPEYVRRAVVESNCSASAFSLEGAVPHAETAARLSEASILLLTSAYEGTPLVILEALCIGTPVVAPAVGGIAAALAAGGGMAVGTRGQTPLQTAETLARAVVAQLRAGQRTEDARLRQHTACMAMYGLSRFQATVESEFRELADSVDPVKRQREIQSGRVGYWAQLLDGGPLQ